MCVFAYFVNCALSIVRGGEMLRISLLKIYIRLHEIMMQVGEVAYAGIHAWET